MVQYVISQEDHDRLHAMNNELKALCWRYLELLDVEVRALEIYREGRRRGGLKELEGFAAKLRDKAEELRIALEPVVDTKQLGLMFFMTELAVTADKMLISRS
jgi:hypothetical protein